MDLIVFPGQDYNNARIYDFEDVKKWENNKRKLSTSGLESASNMYQSIVPSHREWVGLISASACLAILSTALPSTLLKDGEDSVTVIHAPLTHAGTTSMTTSIGARTLASIQSCQCPTMEETTFSERESSLAGCITNSPKRCIASSETRSASHPGHSNPVTVLTSSSPEGMYAIARQ